MKPFETIKSTMVPLDIPNVDTDQIIPKQFLKRVERSGFGQFLFFDWRYTDGSTVNPDFIMNQPQYSQSKILLARDNFGCGSSREHAPWALMDYGFQVIIAPSYADIFYNNCFQNGILPIKLSSDQMDQLFQSAEKGSEGVINLENQNISVEKDGLEFSFEIDPEKKEKLLKGLDDISWTLQFQTEIQEHENTHPVY